MNILWKLPGPSSGRLESVSLQELPGRAYTLRVVCEDDDAILRNCEVRFDSVEAFRCWFLPAITVELIETAYDQLVDMGATSWLQEASHTRERLGFTGSIRHLRICLDDGPCYEFICRDYSVELR